MVVPSDTSDDDLESRPDTFTDQSSVQEPRQPIRRNQLTASTRRQSFAQKYGLNSQQNRSDLLHPMQGRHLTDDFDESDEEEDSEDDRPLQPLPEPSQKMEWPDAAIQQRQRSGGMARPVSVCNIAEATSPARPSRFVKPATQAVRHVEVPSDMQPVQRLSEHFNHKVYMEGYLAKMNDLTVDGRPCADRRWAEHYVELCGPVLTLWNTETSSDRAYPEYINVTDSLVDLVDDDNHQFMLNSAGENRFLFQAHDANAQTWALAIRLACFECSRIHEIYTRRFVSRYAHTLVKRPPKVEGWLQVRFPGQTEWKKYWTVVTDRRTEKRFFGKKSVPTRGQLMFYESKKAKLPVKTIVNVVQAYTIYPESPQLIDLATMMKLEGNIHDNKPDGEQKLLRAAASTLLVAANPRELAQWLVGTFDAFKLYGRPIKFLDEAADSKALNFGEPKYGKDLPRLFLEVAEAQHLNVRGETLLDNKLAFADILKRKLLQQRSVPAPNTAGVMGSRTNSMPLISGLPATPGSYSLQEDGARRPLSNTVPPPQTHRFSAPLLQQVAPPQSMQAHQPPITRQSTSNLSLMAANRQHHQTYASDDSDSDDASDDDDNDTESTSSIYEKTIPVSKPTTAVSTPSTPATPATATPPKASPSQPSQKSPLPQNNARRPSAMTLPEISESNDFISSILGDMSLDHNNNNNNNNDRVNPGPPPPPPAHITPIASASTPILQLSSQQLRDNPKYQNSSSSSGSSIASNGKKMAASPPPQLATKQRPVSGMAWRRSSSNLLMRPQSSSSGSSSSVSMTPSVSESSSMGHPSHQQHRATAQPQQRAPPDNANRRSMMYMNDHGGRRSSSGILLQQHWEVPEEEHEHYPMHNQPQHHQGYPQYDPYYQQQQQQAHLYADGHETDDDAPIIPHPGTNFVTQNSLLDMYQADQLSARLQEENARMSGQPLVSLPNKPPQPRSGLVGMISQLETDRKERESVKGRLLEMEKERALEQERGRFHYDQQQQQQRHAHMMQQQQQPSSPSPVPSQMMASPQTPYGMMMMDPRMSMPPPMMNPQMMMMPMMNSPQMMDPRMSMMPNMAMMYMMQGSYGQMAPSMPMFYNPMMMPPQEKVEDGDDDVPLGAHGNHHRQRQRSNSQF